MRRPSVLRNIVRVTLSVAVMAAVFVVPRASLLAATVMGDCAAVDEGTVPEPAAFTPFKERRGAPLELPISQRGAAELGASIDASAATLAIAGMTRRWTVVLDGPSVYSYFWDRDIPAAMTPDDFWAKGGAQYEVEPIGDSGPFWAALVKEFPDRATPVKIGPHSGAIVWADPQDNGVRTHNVYWSDNTSNFALILDRDAGAAVSTAREVACQ